jgi:hypothetical protein
MAKRKPGKYDHLFPKLRKLPPQDLEYQQKVECIKKEIRTCVACEGRKTTSHTMVGEDRHDIPCSECNGTGRRTLTGGLLVAEYAQARAQKELLEDAVSKLGVEVEALTQLLIASQEQGDSDWGAYGASDRSIKMTDGDALRVQPDVFAMVRDKKAFRDWCYTNATLTENMELPEKKTNDLIKAILLNGKKEPPGIEVYVRTRVVYTPMKTEVTSSSDEQTNNDEQAEIF